MVLLSHTHLCTCRQGHQRCGRQGLIPISNTGVIIVTRSGPAHVVECHITITFISHEVTELQNHSVCAFSFSSQIISFNSFRIASSGAFYPVHNSIWAALWNWTYQDHSGFCSPSSQHFSGMRSWTGCSRHQNKTVLAWLVQIFVYGFLYCPWFCVLSPY